MSQSRSAQSQRGFSMIELLMVAFIFAIGLLGLAALLTWNLRATTGGRQRDTAAYLASDVLERLAADGRLSAQFRSLGQAIPAQYLLANAADGVANVYQAVDPTGVLRATFDLDGRPSADTPIFSVEWVRRPTKSVASVATAASQTSEVLVNVSWSEAAGSGEAPTQKWLSCSRMIRY